MGTQKKRVTHPETKNEAMNTIISSIVAKMKENTVSTANEELMEKLRSMELELAAAKGVTTKRKQKTGHPGLPIEKEENERDEQDSGEEAESSPKRKKGSLHPMIDMRPTSCPLKTEAPAGHLGAKIREWCKKLSGKAATVKAKKIEAAVESFQNYYTKTMKAADKANLAEVAVAWGLPVKLAGSMKEPDLVRVLAIASVIAD